MKHKFQITLMLLTLLLSGCAAPLIMAVPMLLQGAQLVSLFTSGGVTVNYDPKQIEQASLEGFGKDARKIAVWPQLNSRIPVKTAEYLQTYKNRVNIVSPSEMTRTLRQQGIDEFLDNKTRGDLEQDFERLCTAKVADVFIATTYDTRGGKNRQSTMATVATLGIIANKSHSTATSTIYDCGQKKVLALTGEVAVETGMKAPDLSETQEAIGELVAKASAMVLGLTPIDSKQGANK
jgi:hypothetical protein